MRQRGLAGSGFDKHLERARRAQLLPEMERIMASDRLAAGSRNWDPAPSILA